MKEEAFKFRKKNSKLIESLNAKLNRIKKQIYLAIFLKFQFKQQIFEFNEAIDEITIRYNNFIVNWFSYINKN